MLRKNEKGVTLIELLVVMFIIGLLFAVLIPRFGGFTKNSEISSADTDIRVMKAALEQHYIDNRDKPLTLAELNQLLDFKVELLPGSPADANPSVYRTVTKKDPWGNPYYIYVSNEDSIYLSVYSYGPDGKKAVSASDIGDDVIMMLEPKLQ